MKDFLQKFQVNEFLIKKTSHWSISLRPQQVTIGSLILSLNRECQELYQMSKHETEDLSIAFGWVNKIYCNSFKPNIVNYLALMMVDYQVHFHIIPRYSNPVKFKGIEYTDYYWPNPPNILESIKMDQEELKNLVNYLKQNIS